MEVRKGALAGLRVLDMTQFFAGPYCGMYFADMGAEVIKIERPKVGDSTRQSCPIRGTVSGYYSNLNRGKYSLCLDLKSEEGKKILQKLIKTADILIENNRPGVMDRLGFGFNDVHKMNPELIYASISGFGQTGPYAAWPGYDLIAQAVGGAMSVTGFPENPPTRGGIPSGDAFGGMNAVIGILAALYYRTSTGKGQYVDISLVDSVVSSLCSYTMYYLWDGQVPDRIGNRYKFTYPYDSFKAKDNWYVLACGTDEHFRKFASLMGMPELADDQRFATRAGRNENYKVLADIINDWSAKQNSEDIISAVRGIGIPVAPILDFQQLCTNEHMRARNMFCTIHDDEAGDIVVTNNPIRMSETDPRISGAVLALGSATEKILSELGYKTDEIRQLKETGIV